MIDAAERSTVIGTAGYSGQGYEHPGETLAALDSAITEFMREKGHPLLLVTGGTKDDGISDITYDLAGKLKEALPEKKKSLIHTAGIVSQATLDEGHALEKADHMGSLLYRTQIVSNLECLI